MDDKTRTALTAMRRILRATETNSKALLRDTGLTPSQLLVMRLIRDAGELTAGDIATRMGITQATTTGLIHKLERRGLIARQKGETDRRQVWLSLTLDGHSTLKQTPDVVHQRFEQRFSDLQDWEQSALISSLERIAEMLNVHELEVAPIFDTSDLDPQISETPAGPPTERETH